MPAVWETAVVEGKRVGRSMVTDKVDAVLLVRLHSKKVQEAEVRGSRIAMKMLEQKKDNVGFISTSQAMPSCERGAIN